MIELIISIFFFIICATVCVQAFVKSHILTQKSENLNHASLICANLSSLFYEHTPMAGQHDYKTHFYLVNEIYQDTDCSKQFDQSILQSIMDCTFPVDSAQLTDDNYLVLLYDANWTPCKDLNQAYFFVICQFSSDQTFCYEKILVGADFQRIYEAIASSDFLMESTLQPKSIIYTLQLKAYHGGTL